MYRCKMSQTAGWGVMVSHRSGETEDTFIADLVVGLSTGQVSFKFSFSSIFCATPLHLFFLSNFLILLFLALASLEVLFIFYSLCKINLIPKLIKMGSQASVIFFRRWPVWVNKNLRANWMHILSVTKFEQSVDVWKKKGNTLAL